MIDVQSRRQHTFQLFLHQFSRNYYSAVWHHSPDFVWHFIVDSGPIREIIEKDRLQMTRGYYADCFQVRIWKINGKLKKKIQTYRNDNVSRAIIIWRKGFGKKYRIQYGTQVQEMLTDMQRTDLEPVQLASLPRWGEQRMKRGTKRDWNWLQTWTKTTIS